MEQGMEPNVQERGFSGKKRLLKVIPENPTVIHKLVYVRITRKLQEKRHIRNPRVRHYRVIRGIPDAFRVPNMMDTKFQQSKL
jgi:hypothetical protein